MRKISRNPFVALSVFCAVFLLLLRAGSTGDRVLLAALWLLLAASSGVAIVKMIRRRNYGPYDRQIALPRRIWLWMLDEDDKQRQAEDSR